MVEKWKNALRLGNTKLVINTEKGGMDKLVKHRLTSTVQTVTKDFLNKPNNRAP